MADTKITGLQTPQVTTNPATDVLPIVNIADNSMAASGSTRKITVNQLLGAGGTATLASATISGDLTVDTSTLKVDSANDRVGVGTASPTSKLHVSNTGAVTRITITDDTTNGRSGYIESNFLDALVIGTTSGVRAIRFSPDNKPYYQIATDGVQTWLDGIGGTRMTLNSTGLGVGGSPDTGLFTIGATTITSATTASIRLLSNKATFVVTADGATNMAGTTINYSWANGTQGPLIFRNASISNVMTLDASGNVGIGVTPSATNSTYFQALEIARVGQGLTAAKNVLTGSPSSWLSNNSYATYSSGVVWNYAISQPAAQYRLFEGQHQWYTAPSGTAGNAITFTERLRLKETGQLRFVPLASDPSGAEAGDVYYNSTSNKLKCYNGTTWNDLF